MMSHTGQHPFCGVPAPRRRASLLLTTVALAAALASVLAGCARAQDTVFEPALRVERVAMLAETSRVAPAGTLVCQGVPAALTIDGDPADWPATASPLAIGAPADAEPAALGATLRAAWSQTGITVFAEIRDPALAPGDAPEDIVSSGNLQMTLGGGPGSAEERSQVFIVSNTAQGPVVLKATDAMRRLTGEGLVAVVDSQGRRTVEVCLPWSELKPMGPTGKGFAWLSVRLEGRETVGVAEPPTVDTAGEPVRLLFLPAPKRTAPVGYLSVAVESVPAGEPVEGTLLVDSPRAADNVTLRLGVESVAADGTERSVARISHGLRLDQGQNAFTLRWDTVGAPVGDYAIRAELTSGEERHAVLRAAVKVVPRASTWAELGGYSATLSNTAVLARITTAREADPNAPLRFAVMGDPRDGEVIFEQALARAAQEGAQFALVLGDLVSSGRSGEYLRLAKLLEKAPLPVLVAAGNHDYKNGGRAAYQRLFGPASYTFELAGHRFIIVDSGDAQLTPARLAWLEKELTRTPAAGQPPPPAFVFTHEPPSTIEKWSWHAFSRGAERFTALMEQYTPARVFVSHIHAYDRATRNGVEYVLTGGAGAPVYDRLGKETAIHHFVMVETGPTGVTDEVVALGWRRVKQATQ